MKKITKVMAIILVLSLFAVMALGSGSSTPSETKAPASVSTGGSSVEKNDSGNTPSATEPAKKDTTIEEVVLVDEKDIKITAKSFEAKGTFGSCIKLLIENNSSKAVTVQARNASVNGYMVETMLSSDVAAGKKANDELVFMRSDLEAAGITTIADMEFSFHIFDSETWHEYLDTDIVSIKTSEAEGFNYTFDNSGFEVYNEGDVNVVVKGLGDSWMGPNIVVYIYNGSGKDICVQARDVSINGFMVESIFSSEVVAGKHSIDTISFLSSDLEKNGIETIDEVELSFHIFDNATWNTIKDTAPVTISFK